jgi:mannose/fructose/N-acetylgalactosamine-specific phosphotransferase system component IID
MTGETLFAVCVLVVVGAAAIYNLAGDGWPRRVSTILAMFAAISVFIFFELTENGYVVGGAALAVAFAWNALLDRLRSR